MILGKNYFDKRINLLQSPSLEAQIASISDDIAYNSHDLEDGLKANLFNLKDLEKISVLDKIIIKHKIKLKKYQKDLVLRQIIREIINVMVKDVIENTKKNLKKNKIKNVNDVYNSKYPLVTFSKKLIKFDKQVKNFLKKNMYYHKDVIKKTNFRKKIVKKLFFKIKKDPKKFIYIQQNKAKSTDRKICDFIAGMTDRFAINLYNRLK